MIYVFGAVSPWDEASRSAEQLRLLCDEREVVEGHRLARGGHA